MRARLAPSLALALLLVLAVSHGSGAQPLAPLVVGGERFFTLTWEVWEDGGRPVVGGYLKNEAGFTAMKIRLLVDALDSSGRVVGQRVSWFGDALTPGTRAYFEAPAPPRATTYRVSVFAYDWVQAAGLQAP